MTQKQQRNQPGRRQRASPSLKERSGSSYSLQPSAAANNGQSGRQRHPRAQRAPALAGQSGPQHHPPEPGGSGRAGWRRSLAGAPQSLDWPAGGPLRLHAGPGRRPVAHAAPAPPSPGLVAEGCLLSPAPLLVPGLRWRWVGRPGRREAGAGPAGGPIHPGPGAGPHPRRQRSQRDPDCPCPRIPGAAASSGN